MKRKSTLLISIFAAMFLINVAFVKAQVSVFSESFESDTLLTQWKSVDRDGDGHKWMVFTASTSAHTGTAYATSESAYEATPGNWVALHPNNFLISPKIDLRDATAPISLSWWIDNSSTNYPAEHYKVVIANDTTIASFTNILLEETLTAGPWTQKTANLNNYAGQQVYIAFVHFNCTDNDRLKLDDVSITAGSVGTSDLYKNTSSFRIIPNPATDKADINFNLEYATDVNITICDVLGNNVAKYNLDNQTSGNHILKVDLSNLNSGYYFVKINSSENIKTAKLIVK